MCEFMPRFKNLRFGFAVCHAIDDPCLTFHDVRKINFEDLGVEEALVHVVI